MNNDERDKVIIETSNDVKWLKEQQAEHMKQHCNYIFMIIGTMFAAIIGWFK